MRKTQHRSATDPSMLDDGQPVRLPATLSPDVAAEAARVMARAEAMGLIQLTDDHTMSVSLLETALTAFARAGIGRQIVMLDEVHNNPRGALELLNQSIVASPHPETEWGAVSDALGHELTAKLMGVSASSLKRYSSGERDAPEAVVRRLHFVAMIVADLAGSYNWYGVRRWFERPRRQLGGKSPGEVLGTKWDPESAAAAKVAQLAAALTALGAT